MPQLSDAPHSALFRLKCLYRFVSFIHVLRGRMCRFCCHMGCGRSRALQSWLESMESASQRHRKLSWTQMVLHICCTSMENSSGCSMGSICCMANQICLGRISTSSRHRIGTVASHSIWSNSMMGVYAQVALILVLAMAEAMVQLVELSRTPTIRYM